MMFFQLFAAATDYDRDLLYHNLEKWWKFSPNYKRRRLLGILYELTKSTTYETAFAKEKGLEKSNDDLVSTDMFLQ